MVGVKLNSGDYVHGGFSEEHSLEHVRTISGWNMVDFIEVSGGDYEDPRMLRRFLVLTIGRVLTESCRIWASDNPSSILQLLLP